MENLESKLEVSPNSILSNAELQPDSVNAVFCIPELRETIISRAVYARVNNETIPCRKTIPSLRLLSKDWFASVSKVLRKDKEPLFHLLVNQENSLNAARMVQNEGGKLLDNFLSRVYFAPWYQENKPTFNLYIRTSFFRSENYNSLLNLLLKCGENLVQLYLWIPKHGGSLICIFPTLSLPSLQHVAVFDKAEETIERQFDDGESLVGSSLNVTTLLNSLLNATTLLRNFSIQNFDIIRPSRLEGFQTLTFPATLTQLKLECEMTSEDLKILIKNRLPNLTNLGFNMSAIPFAAGLVFQVLEMYKETLKVLHLLGKYYFFQRTLESFTLIRFPVMKHLVELKFWGINFQLEPKPMLLQLNLPALKTLHLLQNETGFRKWTESKLLGIETLVVMLRVNAQNPGGPTMAINLENMERLHQAFPNVQSLKLKMLGNQTCGLKYLFREMKQLKKLSLAIVKTEDYKNSDCWDALFIGVSVELIAGLRQSPEMWKTVSLDNSNMPSIRMLTVLETLEVENFDFPSCSPSPLISDLSFIHAFLKMPKLYHLSLFRRFKASSKMQNIWKSLGDSRRIL